MVVKLSDIMAGVTDCTARLTSIEAKVDALTAATTPPDPTPQLNAIQAVLADVQPKVTAIHEVCD